MAINLSTFKTALTFGGARPSLFDLKIYAPVSSIDGLEALSKVEHHCSVSSGIPELTVTPIEKNYFGRIVKFPGELTFGALTTTFTNTEDYEIRTAFEVWHEALNGGQSNLGISGTVSDWTGTVQLTQYQKDGGANGSQEYSFIDCWPSAIGAIELNYDTVGDMETFDITWEYNYYTSINFHGDAGSFDTQD